MKASITLAGTIYALYPTFEALSDIEKELGASITALVVKLTESEMTLEELALIIAKCLEPEMPASFVRNALLECGFSCATQAAALMFSHVFKGMGASKTQAINRQEFIELAAQFPD